MRDSTEAPPRLHVLLDAGRLAGPARPRPVELYRAAAGPVALHIRARLPAVRLFEAARALTEAAGRDDWCVVNGRPDIALAAGADAVQLGRSALPPADVRLLTAGSDLRIGVSVHGPRRAVTAVRDGADFLVVGTMYATPSHPGRPGSGAAGLAAVVEALEAAGKGAVPLLAIGGVDADRVAELIAAGARGVVVCRAVWEAPDPLEALARLEAALADATR